MKKPWKKALAWLGTAMMTLGLVTMPAIEPKAADPFDGEFEVFIGFGGDKAEENDWGMQYNNPTNPDNNPDIVATTAMAKVGDTVTVSLEFPDAVPNVWWMAPVLVSTEKVGNLDATVSLKIDDKDVEIDASQGDAWWYEDTGTVEKDCAIRLYGGFNEWAAQYIAEPSGFKKVEYTITINSAEKASETAVGEDFGGSMDLFIGFGGDKAEENDWGMQYNNPTNPDNNPDIEAVTESIKVGETKTVSLTFPDAVPNVWWMAPVLVSTEKIADMDVQVSLKIDDKDVEIDASQGDAWWYEDTGTIEKDCAIRLYGGFNEWAAQYIAEPSGFKKVEYTVTLNSAKVAAATATDAEEAAPSVGEVDKDNPDYNAYILIQSPKYSFRNAWYDAQYGLGYTDDTGFDYFNQITGWDADGNALVIPGTIQDAKITGNGTYTVSVTGLQFAEDDFKDQDHFNIIGVDTDIPFTEDIVISDMELSVNGMGVDINPVVADVEETNGYLTMMIQNIWNEDIKETGYTPTPVTDISITFTVSGFNKDGEAVTEAPAATEETATTEAAAAETKEEEKSGMNKGLIAGIAAAGVAVVAIVVGVVVGGKKKDEKEDK